MEAPIKHESPFQNTEILMKELLEVEKCIAVNKEKVNTIKNDTEDCFNMHNKRLIDGNYHN